MCKIEYPVIVRWGCGHRANDRAEVSVHRCNEALNSGVECAEKETIHKASYHARQVKCPSCREKEKEQDPKKDNDDGTGSGSGGSTSTIAAQQFGIQSVPSKNLLHHFFNEFSDSASTLRHSEGAWWVTTNIYIVQFLMVPFVA
ncbi:hypothetical protein BKA81DRAFT_377649 [Phyllosticta paracitricarpa]